ncbi:MAG: hypothetical protein ACI9OJ_003671, partial [Myxococcota bacterium]
PAVRSTRADALVVRSATTTAFVRAARIAAAVRPTVRVVPERPVVTAFVRRLTAKTASTVHPIAEASRGVSPATDTVVETARGLARWAALTVAVIPTPGNVARLRRSRAAVAIRRARALSLPRTALWTVRRLRAGTARATDRRRSAIVPPTAGRLVLRVATTDKTMIVTVSLTAATAIVRPRQPATVHRLAPSATPLRTAAPSNAKASPVPRPVSRPG